MSDTLWALFFILLPSIVVGVVFVWMDVRWQRRDRENFERELEELREQYRNHDW